MGQKVLENALQYSCQFLELGFIIFVFWRGYVKRLAAPTCYLGWFLVVSIFRWFVLQRYGLSSRQYFYTYFLSDFLLVVAAFLVVCTFFRRACIREHKLWHFVRLFLIFTFVIVVGISALSLSRNYSHLFSTFIIEFEQNVYFACLVLNTLLCAHAAGSEYGRRTGIAGLWRWHPIRRPCCELGACPPHARPTFLGIVVQVHPSGLYGRDASDLALCCGTDA
jgi:hypothetical protein